MRNNIDRDYNIDTRPPFPASSLNFMDKFIDK